MVSSRAVRDDRARRALDPSGGHYLMRGPHAGRVHARLARDLEKSPRTHGKTPESAPVGIKESAAVIDETVYEAPSAEIGHRASSGSRGAARASRRDHAALQFTPLENAFCAPISNRRPRMQP